MKIKTVINDFKAMGLEESCYRLLYEALKRSGYFIRKDQNRRSKHTSFIIANDLFQKELHMLKNHNPYEAAIQSNLQNILNYTFPLFNQVIPIQSEQVWMFDWCQNVQLANDCSHWSQTSVSPETSKCDPRTIWELNRFAFFPWMAIGYALKPEEHVLVQMEQLLQDWLAANPYFTGINWTSNMEVALRATNLLIGYLFMYPLLSHKQQQLFSDVLIQHFEYVHDYLFWTGKLIPNDHYLVEALLLYAASIVMNIPQAEAWKKQSEPVIREQLNKQFDSTGKHFMNSLNYQKFATEALLLCIVCADKVSPDPSLLSVMVNKLSDSCKYLNENSVTNSVRTNFGDSDSGGAFRFCFERSSDCSTLFRLAAAYTNNPQCKQQMQQKDYAPQVWEDVFGKNQETQTAQPPLSEAVLDSSSDVHVLQAGPMRLEFYCHNLTDYGHSDILQVCLYVNNQPALIDPGTFFYSLPLETRNKLRGTAQHNTLTVANENQAVEHRYFRWSSEVTTTCDYIRVQPADAAISAIHNGYQKRLPGKPLHRRTVFQIHDMFIIVDQLIVNKAIGLPAEINYQLADGLEFLLEHNLLSEASHCAFSILIDDVHGSGNLALEASMQSHAYTESCDSSKLRYQVPAMNENHITTIIASGKLKVNKMDVHPAIFINGIKAAAQCFKMGEKAYYVASLSQYDQDIAVLIVFCEVTDTVTKWEASRKCEITFNNKKYVASV